MRILSGKRYKELLEYEEKYRYLTGQTITLCTGERSRYKALLSLSKEELVHLVIEFSNAIKRLKKDKRK